MRGCFVERVGGWCWGLKKRELERELEVACHEAVYWRETFQAAVEDRDTYKRRLAEVDDQRRVLAAEVAKWRGISESLGKFTQAQSTRNENQASIIRNLKKQVREAEGRAQEAEDRLVEVADIADRREPVARCGDVIPNPSGPGLARVTATTAAGDVFSSVPLKTSPFEYPFNTGIKPRNGVGHRYEWQGKGQFPPARWFNQPGGRP